MNHQSNVIELLNEVRDLISGIEQAYVQAKTAESVVVVARPKVKSCLEHLRSALDYIAHDLSETTDQAKPSKQVYFPYGKDAKLYQESLKRNLPGLDSKYLPALESLQPHVCGDEWLIQLCKANNVNKHIRLENQERQNSPESTTKVGNIARIEGGGSVTIGKLFIDGVHVNPKGPLVLTGTKPVAEIESELSLPIPVAREYKWVKFVLANSGVDVLELLKKSHDRIQQFTDELYSI